MRIVFEGLPGAGKTTLSTWASQEFQLPLIPEWAVYSETEWRRFSLVREHFQCNDEVKEFIAGLHRGPVLMDRHYVGCLAYDFAHGGRRYQQVMGWYREAIREGRLTAPQAVVHLVLPPQQSGRRQPRAGAHQAYAEVQLLARIADFYEQFYTQIEADTRRFKIDATRPQEEVRSEVGALLQKLLV